jgi:hypothetical protein
MSTFYNRFEIEDLYRWHEEEDNIVVREAIVELYNWMETVDFNSDGWPYNTAGSNAAAGLIDIIEGDADATPQNLKKALTRVKSLKTRKGWMTPSWQ